MLGDARKRKLAVLGLRVVMNNFKTQRFVFSDFTISFFFELPFVAVDGSCYKRLSTKGNDINPGHKKHLLFFWWAGIHMPRAMTMLLGFVGFPYLFEFTFPYNGAKTFQLLGRFHRHSVSGMGFSAMAAEVFEKLGLHSPPGLDKRTWIRCCQHRNWRIFWPILYAYDCICIVCAYLLFCNYNPYIFSFTYISIHMYVSIYNNCICICLYMMTHTHTHIYI